MAYVKRTVATVSLSMGLMYGWAVANEAVRTHVICQDEQWQGINQEWCSEPLLDKTNAVVRQPEVILGLGGTALLLAVPMWLSIADYQRRNSQVIER